MVYIWRVIWTGYAYICECDTMEPTGIQHVCDYEDYWHDWRFITHSRQDVPELVAEVRRLREVGRQAANQLEGVALGLEKHATDINLEWWIKTYRGFAETVRTALKGES